MKKILLIEDNRDIRENTEELLTLAGYEVKAAENGKIGVDMAIKEQPDLIICDIMMPELDGYGVLHILSKRTDTAAIPFIFLTAMTEKSEVRKGMEMGADDYLTKPFDDTSLLNAIEARFRKRNIRNNEYAATSEGLTSFLDDAGRILNLKRLIGGKKVTTVKKKTELFAEGDAPTSVFLLQSGEIKVSRLHQDGKELITNLYTKNSFFGFEAILENAPYTESAVAVQDSEVIIIPKEDFLTLVYSHPDVSAAFISMLCKKVVEKENALLNLAYSSVRQRTASALLKSMDRKDEKGLINIAREDLARIIGTASESVIRVMADFKDEGLIVVESGKIRILKPEGLEKVVKWNVAR
jgi:CRP-like cAMP-binding protein/FixJ family two-component response regulator